jgi:uncharacterized membrane protein YdjX (TVP38/TMEM64 family)
MTVPAGHPATSPEHPLRPRRIAALVVLVLLVLVVSRSDSLHQLVVQTLTVAERTIRENPRLGPLLFLALAAASAMLAFFSSAALVPVGVFAWGGAVTFLLIWGGWTLGGIAGYGIARTLGRPVVHWLLPRSVTERYERIAASNRSWFAALLFQLALPSEIPSYVFGLIRYPFGRYLLVVAIGEAPFAAMDVFLGDAFIRRQASVFAMVAVAGLLLTVLAWLGLHQRTGAGEGKFSA